jgi:hypothetical protein
VPRASVEQDLRCRQSNCRSKTLSHFNALLSLDPLHGVDVFAVVAEALFERLARDERIEARLIQHHPAAERVVLVVQRAHHRRAGRRRIFPREVELIERVIGIAPCLAGGLDRLADLQAVGVNLVDVLLVLDEPVGRLGQVEG